MAGAQAHVFLHLLLLRPTQAGEPFGPLPESRVQCRRGKHPLPSCLTTGDGIFQRKEQQGFLDATPLPMFKRPSSSGTERPCGSRFKRLDHLFDFGCGGERAFDEVVGDPGLFFAAEQDAISRGQCTPRPSHLLVICDDRTRHLIVNDESEIGLVVAHSQGPSSPPGLSHAIFQQGIFQFRAPLSGFAGIGFGIDFEGVNDTAAVQSRNLPGEPGHAQRLSRQANGLEKQRGRARSPRDTVRSGRRGRRQQPQTGRQGAHHPLDDAVVRPEIVAPVGNAVGFVHHQQ